MKKIILIAMVLVGCTSEPQDVQPDAGALAGSDSCCDLLPDIGSAEQCAKAEFPNPGVCFDITCSGGQTISVCNYQQGPMLGTVQPFPHN